jgi:hypothetical protein
MCVLQKNMDVKVTLVIKTLKNDLDLFLHRSMEVSVTLAEHKGLQLLRVFFGLGYRFFQATLFGSSCLFLNQIVVFESGCLFCKSIYPFGVGYLFN